MRTRLHVSFLGAFALGLFAAGCSSGKDDPQLVAANDWLQKVKAERRDDAEWLSNACIEENGLPLTRDGLIAHVDCMKRKDEQEG